MVVIMEQKKKIGEWKDIMAEELTEVLKRKPNIFLTNYLGLKADELNELRRSLEPYASKYLVVKNSIVRVALKNAGFGELVDLVDGGIGLALGGDDPIVAVKVLNKFSKSHEALKLKGGYLQGEVIDKQKINYIASLPSREQLIAKVVFGIKSPITGFVNILGNTLRNFVYVIQAIKDKEDKYGRGT